MKLRRILFWAHLIVGCVAGLLILSMCISGSLLAFEPQITAFSERDVATVAPPVPGTKRLAIDTLVGKAVEAHPQGKPNSLTLKSDANASAMVNFESGDILFLNPYTGDVLGHGSNVRRFLHSVEEWHRWFGNRHIGQPISAAAAFAFFLLSLSGLILWWPRSATPGRFRKATRFQSGLQGRAQYWNLHTVVGFWLSPFILIITATGIFMASSKPPRQEKMRGEKQFETTAEPLSLDALWTRAETQATGWRSITQRFSKNENAPAQFFIVEPNVWPKTLRSSLTLDARTGAVLKWESHAHDSLSGKGRLLVTPLHTGRAWGLFGQMINLLVAVGGTLLIWTGFSMAWRRFRS